MLCHFLQIYLIMKKKSLILVVILSLCVSLFGCELSSGKFDFTTLYEKDVYKSSGITTSYNEQGLVNAVTTEKMSAIVTVYSEQYTDFFGITVSSTSISQGSAGIFYCSDGVYYALTNNHVVCKDASYSSQDIFVEDCYGNVYDAYVYQNPEKTVSAISPLYDLAVICFKAKEKLETLSLASANPVKNDTVVLVGTPEGQKNAILFANIIGYVVPNVEDSSTNKINFEVVTYDCSSKQGSSGGPIINNSLEIVGVHFGGGETQTREYGGAVPILKVKEFLSNYCLS